MNIRLLGLGFLFLCLLSNCQVKRHSTSAVPGFILHGGMSYQIDSEADLSALITVLAKDDGIWLENVRYEEIQAVQGDYFPAITADYLDEDKGTTLLIPLDQIAESDYEISCLMACATKIGCVERRFEVIQACRELNCGCEFGDGGGSSTVMFY